MKWRSFIVICLSLFLASCSARPLANMLRADPDAASPQAKYVNILVATSRGYDKYRRPYTFDNRRSQHLNFQALTMSIPPDHQIGHVEYNNWKSPTPQENINTVKNEIIDEKTFMEKVDQELPPSGEVLVFVHGYNTKHQEAVLRLTQIAFDADLHAESILFSWPSLGRLTMYLADRESSTAARNRLNDLLVLLQKDPKVKRINILAHSMGCMLTADTLMMATLAGDGEYGGKLYNVTLAAPDIDIDVFLAQMEIIGRRNKPTVVLFSNKDGALAASRALAGDVPRVGDFNPRTAKAHQLVKEYGLSIINLTDLAKPGSLNHSVFATSSATLAQIGTYLGGSGEVGAANNVGVFALGLSGSISRIPSGGLAPIGNMMPK